MTSADGTFAHVSIQSHVKMCWGRYVLFFLAWIVVYYTFYTYSLFPPIQDFKESANFSSQYDVLQVLLGICGLTIPLLLGYLMHPHVGLYEYLAFRLEHRLGSKGIYSQDIRDISAEVAQSTSNISENLKRVLWILEHKLHEASDVELDQKGKDWLLDKNGVSHHGNLRAGLDRQGVIFLVLRLAFCMIVSVLSLCICVFTVHSWWLSLIPTASALCLATNLFAYFYLVRLIGLREKLRSSGIRVIDTNFEDIAETMIQIKSNIRQRTVEANRATQDAQSRIKLGYAAGLAINKR